MASRKPKLGQNFLIDQAACLRIAESLGDLRTRTVLEIGPGHGAITAHLATRCRQLHCIEFDPALAAELTARFHGQPHITIHHADILGTDLKAFLPPADDNTPTLDVFGNLPYYITSDILLHLYSGMREGTVARAAVMMQSEVAERITAAPGVSDYGALSALTRMHAAAESLLTLSPAAFAPPPDVFSNVVRLTAAPRFAELGVAFEPFNRFLRSTFAQKRKTLANNLRAAGFSAGQLAAAWPSDLPAQVRSEAVPLEALAALYRALTEASSPA